MTQQNIRNFCIIAHIDHGKSTLADRILEFTGTVSRREMRDQILDSMALERERGITIKLKAVKLLYTAQDGMDYYFNLIDTPGHVDFAYEVSRSLAACEGALLVIDAVQGVEAQTMANVYLALEHNLEIIPVINKIDLPNADPERVQKEIEELLGLDGSTALQVSAKEGTGIVELLEAIVERIPPPSGSADKPLQALIFDSSYNSYRGVVAFVRLMQGTLKNKTRIKMMSSGKIFEVAEIGVFRPLMTPVESLMAGEVGYVIAGIKNVQQAQVGDTITQAENPASQPLPGYRQVTPMVYAGLFPVESDDYAALKDALDKLKLNDAALVFEPEDSPALGFGFRCGFLGLLHMEIVQQRLEREYNLDLIITAPNVVYKVLSKKGETFYVHNPAQLPPAGEVEELSEPFVDATIIVPHDYVGAVMELASEKRGHYQNMEYMEGQRVVLTYRFPLSEIIFDFFDLLKSRTKGFASFDYSFWGYSPSPLVKIDILVAGEPVDALSFIEHRDKAQARGRALISSLKELIPRGLFDIPLQAASGSKPFARETIKALRKNVLDKCYGGDITRKRKLLEKQKAGKRRMKQVGRVEIPQEAFLAVLQKDKGEH